MSQKITPHLWFDKEAEEAVNLYISIFNNGKINSSTRYVEAGKEIHGMEPGTIMTMSFQIEGYNFLALNGGPIFKFTPAISFMVNCPTVEEVDILWNKLVDGGKVLMPIDTYPYSKRYGWLEDKFGVSWQLIENDKITERKIVPSLMFANEQAGRAEEAMNFYMSLFENSEAGILARYGADQTHDKEGSIMFADFNLAGQKFAVMDSAISHDFKFNEAVSLLITCKDQTEIDHFWSNLSAVPESEQCGWLKDKFGVSWQVVPEGMEKMLNNPDRSKAEKAMQAMMHMKKFDIKTLEEASS